MHDATAIGIVQTSIFFPTASATVITAGEWNEDISAANGIHISADAKIAMKAITFKNSDGKPIKARKLPEPSASKNVQANSYGTGYEEAELPIATDEAAGLVKIGSGISVDEDGTISVTIPEVPVAEYVDPTDADLGDLVDALVAAGLMEAPPEE